MTTVTECLAGLAYSREPRGASVVEGESQAGSHEFWRELESIAHPRVYKSGSSLFDQGAEPTGIYFIRQGNVRVFVTSRARQRVLAEATPGTILGLSECFSAEKHKVSAEASSRVEVSFVDRRRLMMYLREHPTSCMQIVRFLSEDLRTLYQTFRLARSRPGSRKIKPDNTSPEGE